MNYFELSLKLDVALTYYETQTKRNYIMEKISIMENCVGFYTDLNNIITAEKWEGGLLKDIIENTTIEEVFSMSKRVINLNALEGICDPQI